MAIVDGESEERKDAEARNQNLRTHVNLCIPPMTRFDRRRDP